MEQQEKYDRAVTLLREKAELLGRMPKKEDFTGNEVCFIKQKLGPWTRALEKAGLKEPPAVSAAEKSRIKRERAKNNRKIAAREERLKKSGSVNLKEEDL